MRPILVSVLVGISLFFSAVFLLSPEASSEKYRKTDLEEPVEEAPASTAPPAPPAQEIARHDIKLSNNDTFYSLMTGFNVPAGDIHAVARMARPHYDLRHLRRGTVVNVTTADGGFEKLEYRFGDYDVLTIERATDEEAGYRVSKAELPTERRQVVVTGAIETSLFEDGVKAGADPRALVELSDIFAWDIDFASDIRKGDTFSILTEVLYVDGEAVRTERVLGAEMVNGGKRYAAIHFEGKSGSGYYDENGKSLRRTLLKSPLRYRRISSYFTKKRYHPVLKKYRPHHGIDYAAPTGTPVEAAGSGKITFSGWKRGYGKFITIRHNNGYSTAYGHLSRIGKGIVAGAKVGQGDVIGYVGSTGISTGPHLHYEVRLNNNLINPLSIKAVSDTSIGKGEKEGFAMVKADVKGKLAGVYAVAATDAGLTSSPESSKRRLQ
ncbi:MAG: peptidoglycan DD-metalloendopeptidase family protein [Deltaproteobacteria bacterium]|nr:peptidoglycan DD-metalloendopeptidase family protein [Deltaproteobacteria bacterium]